MTFAYTRYEGGLSAEERLAELLSLSTAELPDAQS